MTGPLREMMGCKSAGSSTQTSWRTGTPHTRTQRRLKDFNIKTILSNIDIHTVISRRTGVKKNRIIL